MSSMFHTSPPSSESLASFASWPSVTLEPDHGVISLPHESNGVDNPHQSSTSTLLHSDPPRGRTLWRFDDDYLTPGPNSRSLSLSDIDNDVFGLMRSPSVAPSTHSDCGIDLARLDLNPDVVTSGVFSDIPEQQSNHPAKDALLPPMPYREQVAFDAVARASRRINAAHYVCTQCNQTFTAKHNLRNHLNSHYGVRNFRCEVPNCGKSFGTSHVRRRHMIKCHSESTETKRRKLRQRIS